MKQDKVLERVQQRAVRMVSNLRERSYETRLAEAGMAESCGQDD